LTIIEWGSERILAANAGQLNRIAEQSESDFALQYTKRGRTEQPRFTDQDWPICLKRDSKIG
jgi:hypothetical protein